MNEYQHQDLVPRSETSAPPVAVPVSNRMKLAFIITLFLSVLIANFVFLHGFALGFFITVAVAQAALFIVLPKPASRKVFSACIFFSAGILGLGAAFFLYSDALLAFLDFYRACSVAFYPSADRHPFPF